jgi:hypothetical protein
MLFLWVQFDPQADKIEIMKSSVFWDITPCSPLKVNQHFRGTCHFHFQGQRLMQETGIKQAVTLVSTLLHTRRYNHLCENLKSYKIEILQLSWESGMLFLPFVM